MKRKARTYIDSIVDDMHANILWMPEKYAVDENTIIEKLRNVDDLEQKDQIGRTLLVNAVLYQRKETVKHLLERNVDVNVHVDKGATALHLAAKNGDVEIIKLLLDRGAEVDSLDMFGCTPIMRCSHLAPISAFELFLSYGADPKIKNDLGVCALDCFAAYPNIMNVLTNVNTGD